jgi:hypothetical protein
MQTLSPGMTLVADDVPGPCPPYVASMVGADAGIAMYASPSYLGERAARGVRIEVEVLATGPCDPGAISVGLGGSRWKPFSLFSFTYDQYSVGLNGSDGRLRQWGQWLPATAPFARVGAVIGLCYTSEYDLVWFVNGAPVHVVRSMASSKYQLPAVGLCGHGTSVRVRTDPATFLRPFSDADVKRALAVPPQAPLVPETALAAAKAAGGGISGDIRRALAAPPQAQAPPVPETALAAAKASAGGISGDASALRAENARLVLLVDALEARGAMQRTRAARLEVLVAAAQAAQAEAAASAKAAQEREVKAECAADVAAERLHAREEEVAGLGWALANLREVSEAAKAQYAEKTELRLQMLQRRVDAQATVIELSVAQITMLMAEATGQEAILKKAEEQEAGLKARVSELETEVEEENSAAIAAEDEADELRR